MKRKIRVTLDLTFCDLTSDARKECAEIEDCKISDLPRIRDYHPNELVECISGAFEDNAEIFAGSGVYARITDCAISDVVELQEVP